MAGDDDAVVIDQNWNKESKCGNAVGNLTDLLALMRAGITTIRREVIDAYPA